MTDRSKLSFTRLMAGEGKPKPARSDKFRIVDRDVRRNIALSLEDMRDKLRLSKLDFCDAIGISYRNYLKMVKGRRGMSIASLILLSRLTGYSLMRLLKLKESGYFEDMVE